MKKLSFILSFFVLLLTSCGDSGIQPGDTFSSEKNVDFEGHDCKVKTSLIFQPDNEVILALASTDGMPFPIGFGKYNPDNGEISFRANEERNREVMIFKDEDIVLKTSPAADGGLKVMTDDRFLSQLMGIEVEMKKEPQSTTLSDKLVGKTYYDESEYAITEFQFVTPTKLYSKTTYLDDGDSRERYIGYMLIDNTIAIKTGDNLDDENIIGIVSGNGNTISGHRDGIDPGDDIYITCTLTLRD